MMDLFGDSPAVIQQQEPQAPQPTQLVLVLGDLHIPHRAAAIPEQLQRILVPDKVQHVLCTGNLISADQLDELRK